ncbi:class I SAM-dependent DNA methyltransferase [Rhizobium leguminosarum]|uniref:class I SAM-dependent DNA methyltransferase n=1 Tax=Rhizobium leguminosarum TaxID=384 RepID=UPI001440EE97|nr:DNA methyltransferase [Rhizobium leguminosarum]NKL66269.1 N-6 DNA methylase [Rhizobium leguminosarum bv. viciae]
MNTSSNSLSVDQFVSKWENTKLNEKQAAQSHFHDICRLLNQPYPTDVDQTGSTYCFEKGAMKSTGGAGWADVWKRGYFAWEYKGPRKDLNDAFKQLQQYVHALENPPLLVTCDLKRFEITTNWTNTVSKKFVFNITDLRDAENLATLRAVFTDPEQLKPGKTRTKLTEDVAGKFAELAQRLRERPTDAAGTMPDALEVAHFIIRLMFCMFAQGAELLPKGAFSEMLRTLDPTESKEALSNLFAAMRKGGRFGPHKLAYFNGGLFGATKADASDDDIAFALTADDIKTCINAAREDWSEIDPSIMGTLFVRGLDPRKRSQLGAEYTDYGTIKRIVDPVVIRPLNNEWNEAKLAIQDLLASRQEALISAIASASDLPELEDEIRAVRSSVRTSLQMELFQEPIKHRRVRSVDQTRKLLRTAASAMDEARTEAERKYNVFLAGLRAIRVLDPACGSGNFLYVVLAELKNLERLVMIEAERFGFTLGFPKIGPENVFGIEKNAYAAELARVSVWIGEIQWMKRNGFNIPAEPILRPLNNILHQDALVNEDGSKTQWPYADVIVGNPPYKGAKLMKRELGIRETEDIRAAFYGRLPGFTDLVCYWFENAREMIEKGVTKRAGFVATNSIRKNTNLAVMKRIAETTSIYDAWPEEQWVNEGAQVDVSLICFGDAGGEVSRLNGEPVLRINSDLTSGTDLTVAQTLRENVGLAGLGIQKSGPFDVPGVLARKWMDEPNNINGIPNYEVLKPFRNGDDLTERPRDVWLIDLPLGLSSERAQEYESLYRHLHDTKDSDGLTVAQTRANLGERAHERWWEPLWPRPEMRKTIRNLPRYAVTARTSKHHIIDWQSWPTLPDENLVVFFRSDDLMFGLLQSRFHALWALKKGSDLEDRPRYTHTSVTATYPFPDGMTPNVPVKDAQSHELAPPIEKAAKALSESREAWLWPKGSYRELPEKIDIVDPSRIGPPAQQKFPLRRLPADDTAKAVLSSRQMTTLYNNPPDWLATRHAALDAAVAAAYGWSADITDEEVLANLLEINLSRVR